MGRIKEEDLQLNIYINSAKGKKEIQSLEQDIKETKEAIDVFQKSLEAGRGDQEKLTAAIAKGKEQLEKYEKKYERLTKTLNLSNMTLSELRRNAKLAKIQLDNAEPGTENWKKYNQELNETRKRIRELSSGAKSTSGAISSMAKRYIGIGASVALLARGVKNAVSNIADFEQANVNLSTILGVNVKQMGLLMDDALELGRRTQYTASQVTGLQTELAKLGFTQQQIHLMTAPTLNFATAVGTDLSSAAAMAGATLRIFGLEAKDTEDTLGVLAVSTNRSALNFSYLQTAMSTVGPVAKSFGFSLRDTTTLLGTLANAGFDASSAATATRNILLNLADSSGKLATALGKPVKTFPELMEGLQTLQERGINLNEALAITDKRSVSAFSRFLEGTKDAEALRDALEDVNGELDRIAKERMNTVQGAVKSLQSAWEGFTLAFSNSKGPIKSFLQWMANTINLITDKLQSTQKKNKANAAEYVDYLFTQEEDEAAVRKRINDYVAHEQENLHTLTEKLAAAAREEKRELKKKVEAAQDGLDFAYMVEQAFMERQGVGASGASGASGTSGSAQSGNQSGAGIDTSKDKWSLSSDESFLTAKAALTKRYNDGEIKSKEEFDEQLYQLEIASLSARLALHKEKGADRAAIEADIQKRIMTHDEAARKEAEKLEGSLQTDRIAAARTAEQRRYQEDLKAFEKSKSAIKDQSKAKEDIEAKHRRNLAKIDSDAENERLRLQSANNRLEIESIRNSHMERIVTMKQGSFEQMQALKAMRFEIASAELTHMQQYLRDLEALLSKQQGDGSTEAEITKTKQAIAQAKADIVQVQKTLNEDAGNTAFSGTGKGSLFGVSESQWQQLFSNLKQGKLGAEDLGAAIAAVGDMANKGMAIASQAIEMTNAKEQQEFKNYQKNNDKKRKELQDRLNAGLISQAQYDKSMADLQEKEDNKQEEMEARQAERQKKANIAQAIIQSALAVAKTFAEWGYPLGIAPAAIMAGLGAAQVALIAATPTGYAAGGMVTRAQDGRRFNAHLSPDKRGFITGATILVGEEGGEYVIPADGLRNPTLAPFIGSIEAARRAGTLRSINFGAVSPMMSSAIPAMAAGGPTAPVQIPAADYSAILEGMKELGRKFETVRAVVPMLGKGGIVEAMNDYDKIRKRGKQ